MEQRSVEPEAQPQLTGEVARRIRRLRSQRGLTARELAEMCIAAGERSLSRSTIAKIESGIRGFITLDELSALARALQVQPHELVGPADPAAASRASRGPRELTATTAPVELDRIVSEVKTLRKGRGLQAGDLEHRVGPQLTELASAQRDFNASPRSALISEITNSSLSLPPDLRVAISASLGLSGEPREMPYLKDRVSWLASQLCIELRAALRRIETAEQLLSENIARELRRRRGRTPNAPDGWRLDQLTTLVRLDTPTPEAHEHRRIVATHPGLTEVVAWMDVPQDPGQNRGGLSVEVLYGGRLERKEQPSSSRYQFVVQLPAPLQPGDEHEYGLLLRMPEGRFMRPHVIFSPECPCNVFDLRVRFGPDDRPAWIRRVDGETVRMLDTAESGNLDTAEPGNDLPLDDAGEIHLRFHDLTMYLCYGLQWAHQQPGAGLEAHG